MTEPVLTVVARATTLAEHVSEMEPATELAPYLGVHTAHHLDAAEIETGAGMRALLGGAAVHDLGWLRRVAVRGEDRFRWLSGMVTNAVETLPDQTGAYNLVLNAQGRIQGDVYVWRRGEELEIEVVAEQYEALMAHFDRFIIMDDVELVALDGQSALGITGPEAGQIVAALGLPALTQVLTSATGAVSGRPVLLHRGYGTIVPHYVLWTDVLHVPELWRLIVDAGGTEAGGTEAGATPVGAASLETLRIVEGIPVYGVDIQSRDLAQETGQDRALSFTKGCYLGQEIVERIRSRGQVHRHLRAVELVSDSGSELPAVGTELVVANSAAGSKPAGTLTSVASVELDGVRRSFAIGMIRAEAEVGNQPLAYAGGKAHILHTPPKFANAPN